MKIFLMGLNIHPTWDSVIPFDILIYQSTISCDLTWTKTSPLIIDSDHDVPFYDRQWNNHLQSYNDYEDFFE